MSGFDVHSLEAYSTIASVTGTNPDLTITVQTGDGAKFGNPQNVTIWPVGVQPTLANSTIGRISAITTDTLTVTTAQEGSSNITVSAGMQIANTITPKVLTDIESGGLLTNTAIANGGIDYANLLSTIFSGQITTFTNEGSGGGTGNYVNVGGVKIAWGNCPTNVNGGYANVNLPTFFSSTPTVVVSIGGSAGVAGTGYHAGIADSASTIYVYETNTYAYYSWIAIGT